MDYSELKTVDDDITDPPFCAACDLPKYEHPHSGCVEPYEGATPLGLISYDGGRAFYADLTGNVNYDDELHAHHELHYSIPEDRNKLAQTYVRYDEKIFFVSTINREYLPPRLTFTPRR